MEQGSHEEPRRGSGNSEAMRYQVEIAPQADDDLAEIVSYIAKNDPLKAEAFGMELVDQALMLSTLPYRGARMWGNPRARKLVYGKYLIVYTIDELGRYVLVDGQQVSRMTILRWPKGSVTLLSRYGPRNTSGEWINGYQTRVQAAEG